MRSESTTNMAVFRPARLNALLPDSAATPCSRAASETERYGVNSVP